MFIGEYMNGKKCLVTGGCGFVGSTLVDKLVNLGHEVAVIDNLSSRSHEKFYYNETGKVKYAKQSVTDYASCLPVFEIFKPDVVFHLAAMTSIRQSIEEAGTCMLVNVVGTENMLALSRKFEVNRFVFVSSSAVYGSSPKKSQKETDELCPTNPYAYSKWFGENICKMNSELYGIDTVCFRPFNIYGPRQPAKGDYAPVIGKFEQQKSGGSPLTVFGDGEQRRDFIHVDDVCDALILGAFDQESQRGEVYNLGSNKNYSVNQIAQMIGGKIEYLPENKGEVRSTLANISKAKANFGWIPKKCLETDYIK